jgi:hypothetical protein
MLPRETPLRFAISDTRRRTATSVCHTHTREVGELLPTVILGSTKRNCSLNDLIDLVRSALHRQQKFSTEFGH